MNKWNQRPKKWGVWLLFLSFPTLICCALPILLVSIGMGSVVASIYGEKLIFLQWFGEHKILVFSFTFSILAFSYWLLFRSGRTCPTCPELAKACEKTRYWNIRFLILATIIGLLGAFSTFGLIYFI